MHQSSDNHSIPMTSFSSGKGKEVTSDIYYYTNQIVNLVFIGKPGSSEWVLIDAGMPNSAKEIIDAAENRFGKGTRPTCILLTHGHFDHIGSIVDLLEEWKGVPVYAHPMEFPFLTGQKDYPEPDSSVQGGLLAKISSLYPHKAINISPVLQELPTDGIVPNLPDWKWYHTPGHSPGHVSFFRRADKVLIAGDAFVTVRQDSFYKVLIQEQEVNGPPPYLTTDWAAAKESVIALNALSPLVAITGHGTFLEGDELIDGLRELAENFEELAVPAYGRFVKDQDKEK
jgi:glyoxylase-like metal-dependent hydrolase (beta-lactamase superfamily II)